MADTITINFGLTKPEPNASADSWGAKLNIGLDSIDALLAQLSAGSRNRIINGGMKLDQRNAGASVAPAAPNAIQYTLDRWQFVANVSGKCSMQQSATVPAGFKNSIVFTSTSSYSAASGDACYFQQPIEGLNTADLNWGTANARPVTVGFWVRSSLTGTFGCAIMNDDANRRSYPFTYTIAAANTWEYKTATIPGDTTGTWYTNNAIGLSLKFNLGSGSTRLGTANSWAGSTLDGVTGCTALIGTNAATLYLTGVKLEAGSTATPYIEDDYAVLLTKCQRYFEVGFKGATSVSEGGGNDGTTTTVAGWTFATTKRAAPALTAVYNSISDLGSWGVGATLNATAFTGASFTPDRVKFSITVASGLTSGDARSVIFRNGAYLTADAEL